MFAQNDFKSNNLIKTTIIENKFNMADQVSRINHGTRKQGQ